MQVAHLPQVIQQTPPAKSENQGRVRHQFSTW